MTAGTTNDSRIKASEELDGVGLDLFIHAPYPMVVSRLTDDAIVLANEKALAFFETDRQAIIGCPASGFYPNPGDHGRLMELLHKRRHVADFETTLKTAGDRHKAALLTVSLVRYQNEPSACFCLADISDRQRENGLYERIGDGFLTGLYILQDQVIAMVNKYIPAYFGYSMEELIGSSQTDYIYPEDRSLVHEASTRMLAGQRAEPYEYRVVDKSGNIRWLVESLVSITYHDKPAILANVIEITEQKKASESIAKSAYLDSLTQLPNRRLFCDRLESSLSFARRYQHKLAVIMMDLDRFKDITDTFGTDVGDELLKAVVQRLGGLFRKEDTFARLSGDEFMVLVPRLDQVNHIFRIAKKILDTLQPPFVIQGQELSISTSAGVALFPNHGQDAESLLRNSDIALNKAKKAGRNQYCLFDTR